MWAALAKNSRGRYGLGFAEIMSQYPIAFQSLLIESVPKGASFEIEVQ
jgi:hypothetical protein